MYQKTFDNLSTSSQTAPQKWRQVVDVSSLNIDRLVDAWCNHSNKTTIYSLIWTVDGGYLLSYSHTNAQAPECVTIQYTKTTD